MANEKNLVPFTSGQSHDEAVKNGRKGGKVSGEARRRKKAMRQSAVMLLEMPVPAKQNTKFVNAVKAQLYNFGCREEEATYQDALLVGIMLRAMRGDVRAAEFIRDTAGENPFLELRKKELQLKREQQNEDRVHKEKNNLLEAIMNAEEIKTDDLPEVE